MQDTAPRIEFRNRTAAFAWGFMAVWLTFLALMTWVLARDGAHPSQPAWLQHGAIALFWLVGIPAAGYLFSLPCTRLAVRADGSVLLTRRTPFGVEREAFAPGTIAAVEVREDRDSDGDPFWRSVMVAADGRERTVREGHAAEDQQAVAARLRGALGLG
jgi:hypothetical protein